MSKGTKRHSIRIEDELWEAALTKAAQHDTTASETIRALLTEWVNKP